MFEFEDADQQEVRRSIAKLSREFIPRFQNEQFYNTVPRDLFQKFAEAGVTGITISEEFGGIGAGPLTAQIVFEEISSVDLGPAIFLSVHNMIAGLVQKFGTEKQKARLLPKLAKGEILGAFALTEPSAGSDAAALQSHAVRKGDGYLLNGSKCFITSAGFADIYIVFAKTAPEKGRDGISAFIVEAGAKGLSVGKPEKKMGGELSPIASLTFDNINVPRENLLGDEHGGYKVALGGLAAGRINIAACANGVSRGALDRVIAHLRNRKQFGSALIEFQGLQFMLADMKMKLEAAQLLTWQAASTLEKSEAARDNRIFPSLAKCYASDAAVSITNDAIMMLGGAGYIKEYEVERLLREAKMLQIVEGANPIQRKVIVREMVRE